MTQTSSWNSLIPESKRAAVDVALQTAFGKTAADEIALLTGGLSPALVYKIVLDGRPYVLRIVMNVDAFNDPVRQYACMTIAADAGIAPRVLYASAEDAVAITDYIESSPLTLNFESREQLLGAMAKTIRALHAAPVFPKFVNYLDAINGMVANFQASKMLPESATEECFRYYAQIQEHYPRHDPDRVSSHNDLNPGNILCDGKKIWLVDWDAAFENDRYTDLAFVGISYAPDEALEEVFLRAYFGDALDDGKRARFFLMEQVCHVFYGTIFLNLARMLKPEGFVHDPGMDVPRRSDFVAKFLTGEVSLASYEGRLLFGKVALNEALHNMKTPRFAESIAWVKDDAVSG
jgi:thiamine kinase-like enzyme